ncbi:MAG: tetratricopeptide repeat protein [Roseburia sp.]|nr:tetratricopeptide repeat protein [Roseburia sp.]MCM1097480.1 tetratricopeptide repeat protein [Ruminococcus flavefaciens]
MQTPFKTGQTVILTDSGREEKITCTIAGVCGNGASCIVYDAVKEDKRKLRIKEYFPVLPVCVRNEKLDVVPEENVEEFNKGLTRFRRSYDLQQELRRDARLTNSIVPAEAYCYGYGTEYIVTTDMTGESFDKRPAESLEELLKIVLSLTKVLGIYHEKGILHLDIKPANLFRIPETDEHIMLFDFDSIVKRTELEEGGDIVSYSPKWAAPEQKHGERKSLCPATDFYAVGAIVFDYLFHRDITSSDREHSCEWNFDEADQRIVENLNPAIFEKLTEFFHKTLAVNIKRRFSSSEELKEFIEELLKLADPRRKYILSYIPNPNSCFVGRETELEEIHERLHSTPALCLYGIDGIGKSELMKQYAVKYKQEYESVIFAPYVDDIRCVFVDDEIFHIYHFHRLDKEEFPAYYKRKMRKFKSLVDAGNKDTLIILDNLTDFEDAGLAELLSVGCKVVITSQADGSVYGLNAMKLDGLSDISDIHKIFCSYYGTSVSEKEWEDIDKIIEWAGRHTLTVELLAKLMKAGRIRPDIMLAKLRSHGFSGIGKERIALNKDNVIRKNSVYELIKSIFDMSNVTDRELYILKNLSILLSSGIHTKRFAKWCGLETCDDVNELVEKGWIKLDAETDRIAVHPVVAAVVRSAAGSDTAWMEPLLGNSLKEYNGDDYDKEYENEVFRNLSDIVKELTDGDYKSIDAANYLKEVSYVLQAAGKSGTYKKALEKALTIYRQESGEESTGVSEIYCELGNLLSMTDPKEAEIYFKKACAICEKVKNDETLVESLIGLGRVNPLKASHYYRQAIDYCRDQETLCDLYTNMGSYYQGIYNFRKARKYYEKALGCLGDCDEDAGFMFSLLRLVRLLRLVIRYYSIPFVKLDKGVFREAEQGLKLLIDYAEQNYRDGKIFLLIGIYFLASRFYLLDKKSRGLAEEYGIKSLNLCLQIEEDERDLGELVGLLCNMGLLYKNRGKLEEAEEMLRQSLEYLEKNDGARITAYRRFASISLRRKNLRLSKQYFLMALGQIKEACMQSFKQGMEDEMRKYSE